MNEKEKMKYMEQLLTMRLYPHVSMNRARLAEIVNTVVRGAYADNLELIRLKERMRTEIVHFRYKKESGEIREAFGTLKQGIIDNYTSGCGKRSYSPDTMTYFDVEKNAFRCFRVENFIEILN